VLQRIGQILHNDHERAYLVEHDQAITTMAAEKYVLGELRGSEREEFEGHFFSCPECARDLRDLSSLAEGARLPPDPPLKYEAAKTRPSGWLEGWRFPSLGFGVAWAGALLIVAIFATYQVMVLRKLGRPQAIASFFLRPETRGEPVLIPVEQIGSFLLIEADLPGSSGSLQWELGQAASNRIIAHDVAAAVLPGASFKVLLSASLLAPGEYTLSVRQATAPAEKAPFEKTWLFKFRMGERLR
jgi:anti-sigma factor RsiW